jgi:hypothetical protein
MRKPDESSADKVWKEKLDSCATRQEAVLLIVLMAALAAGLFLGAA